MKFAIRDDDTAYFTSPEELERAYDFISNGPISLSVVPMTVWKHKSDVFPYGQIDADKEYFDVLENRVLIEYLKQRCDRYDVLLHGYTHEYKYMKQTWLAEVLWKDEELLFQEFEKGLKTLNSALNTNISVFVAPNNKMDRKGIRAIEKLGLNYSGIIQINDRDVSVRYLVNFIKRWWIRLFKKIPYPGILDYGKHKELVAYSLDSFDRLVFEYNECKRKKQPFVIYTHYWKVNESPEVKELLKKIYDYVIDDGAELVGVSDCF